MFASLIFVLVAASLTHAENIASSPSDHKDNYCLLPPYPDHGRYEVSNYPPAKPGERYYSVKLDISCDTGYFNNNTIESIFCVNGDWSASMPICIRDLRGFCSLSTDDLRIVYVCVSAPGSLMSTQECEPYVPSGTVVTPICRAPSYFSLTELSEMHCRNETWDYNPICKPACGLITEDLPVEGPFGNHLELPWQAVIYQKSSEYYKQTCGGSLISSTKIISAAFCFHDRSNGKRHPARDFEVAVNNTYILYNDTRDRHSQYSDVVEIIIKSGYLGGGMIIENNIAIVVVEKPFLFDLYVQPVCLDFDKDLDSTQLSEGNSGKMALWSSVAKNGQWSDVLNVFDFSYMKNDDCKYLMQNFLTKDKFCVRRNKEPLPDVITDFGSGLAFLESSSQRYFLRGVRSVFLVTTRDHDILVYTSIVKHESFIKQYL